MAGVKARDPLMGHCVAQRDECVRPIFVYGFFVRTFSVAQFCVIMGGLWVEGICETGGGGARKG